MEGNIFASYSFTSPSKSKSRGTGKFNVCNSAAEYLSSSHADRPLRDFRVKRIKEETFHCDSEFRSDTGKESSLSSLLEANGKDLDAVASSLEEVKECGDLEAPTQLTPAGLLYVEEDTEDELCPSKAWKHDTSSLPSNTGNRKLSWKFGENNFQRSEDIEDCVPSCEKFSPTQLEKATILRMKKGVNTHFCSSSVAPPHWQRILEEIRKMRIDRDAPVDLFGPDKLVDPSKDAETQKFHVLIAAMLSSQTRDAITAAAMNRLHAMPGGFSVQRVAEDDLTVGALEELLRPVGFYRQKAKHLKTIATMLIKPPYSGSIPSTLSELMKFPGVGPKIGLVVLCAAFGKSHEGFICDSNVRRICCRMGWVPEDSTPDETRHALEKWLPKDLWADLSYLFVGFGQQICKPLGPMCQTCKVSALCPSAFKCGTKKRKSRTRSA